MRVNFRHAEAAASVLLLLTPAIWNRFPFLQYDTGGYLARWFEGYLVASRSTVYGLFAVAGWPLDFWPVVILQAVAAVWMIALILRAFGFGDRRFALLGSVAVLTVATSLPWLAGVLLTDIFAGTSVLALHLVLFAPDKVSRPERVALVLFVAFATATHSATFAVLVAVVAFAAVVRLKYRAVVSAPALRNGAGAIALGAAMLVTTNFALSGQLEWTPGGYGIIFARMLQDGIVTRYLNDHCPQRHFKLCPYRHQLPRTADDFLWSDGPFDKLGRFKGLGDEMRTIVLESLIDYPGQQLMAAFGDFAQQLVLVGSGEGVLTSIWHTYAIIDHYMPSIVPDMRAARQQHGEVSFRALNELHRPVALLSMLALPLVVVLGFRGRRSEFADLGLLAATVLVAVLVNAGVCGILSNPHNRYGARIVWIATFAVALAPMRVAATRTAAEPAAGSTAA